MGLSYTLTRVANSATEPLALSDAKLFLRVDHTDEDSLISQLVVTAREVAETYLRRSLITQTWQVAFDGYAPSFVELPMSPLQSITSVKSVTRAGVETVIDNSNYYTSGDAICFDAAPIGHAVEVVYVAGYGDDAEDVPQPIRQGILAHVGALYENRDSNEIPLHVQSIYAPYRVVRL